MWIDPATLSAGGYAITEAALGGDVLDIVWGSPTRSFAIISDAAYNTSLVAWNPSTGQKLSTLFAPGGFSLADAALDDRGELYVCDNDMLGAPGLYVLSAATGLVLAGPLDAGLPPAEVVFDQVSDVAEVPGPASPAAGGSLLALAPPWPQPAAGMVRTRVSLSRGSRVRVEILDLAGREVRALGEFDWPAGVRDVAWDARDSRGRPVPPGLYLMRARAREVSVSQRVGVAH